MESVVGKGKTNSDTRDLGREKRLKNNIQEKRKGRIMQKKYDNISEILINKGMKSREMTVNDKIGIA